MAECWLPLFLCVISMATCANAYRVFENCKIDLGIILDQSSSLGRTGFAEEKKFVKDLTNTVTISDTRIIVSIMKFSSDANMELFFKEAPARSKQLLDQKIDDIAIRGGLTRTHLALNLAESSMFKNESGPRNGVPKVLIVVTDGQSQSGPAVVAAAAKKLKEVGINIISIGIGSFVNLDELNLMASDPIKDHVFSVPGTKQLIDIVSKVREESCREINCPYKTCVHGEWSTWTGECAQAERFKTLRSMTNHSKVQVGGCAGLSNVCEAAIRETKDLPNPCKKNCTIHTCQWSEWTDWSKTCGEATRVAELIRADKVVLALDCQQAQNEQGCSELVSVRDEQRTTKCKCKSVTCKQGDWTPWTSTCGSATRSRQWTETETIVEAYNCDSVPKQCSKVVEDQQRFVPCNVLPPQETFAKKCHIPFASVGCYYDDMIEPRPLPMLILNERDRTHKAWNGILIDWKNWDTYYWEFVCRCAAKANELGFTFFSAQFYGECWSGPEAGETYSRNGPSTNCIKTGFEKCGAEDKSCVGADKANYVYVIEK